MLEEMVLLLSLWLVYSLVAHFTKTIIHSVSQVAN